METVTLPVNAESLTEYSAVPIRFEEKSRLSAELSDGGLTPKTQNVRTEKHV